MPLEDLYQENILELAREARKINSLSNPSVSFTVNNPICGDQVCIDLIINDLGIVKDYGHLIRGCALCEASAGLVSRNAKGLNVYKLENINIEASNWLKNEMGSFIFEDIKIFTPVKNFLNRHKCVLLSFNALSNACKKFN